MTSTQTGNLLDRAREKRVRPGLVNVAKVLPAIPGRSSLVRAATAEPMPPKWPSIPEELITVFMVQHAGFPGVDGGKDSAISSAAAIDTFGGKEDVPRT